MGQRCLGTLVNAFIRLAEIGAAFAMANNGVLYTQGQKHLGRDLPRIGALLLPMDILAAQLNIGAFDQLTDNREIYKRRAYHNITCGIPHKRHKGHDQSLGLIRGHIHFPVTGNDRLSHIRLLLNDL